MKKKTEKKSSECPVITFLFLTYAFYINARSIIELVIW